ncbi:MBL fold metallo-hydrolase [Fannyhessea vaginae]|uniref:MBL fold metallo-hydrolase n=1 Tax=Fannyhessea vaginae TaxID=82135 RepID=UPI0026EA72D6|nr:MBL fold metallo-hydrolase [Fannyhessea vaginae]
MMEDTLNSHASASDSSSQMPEPLEELQGFIVGPLCTNCYLYESIDNGEHVGLIIDAGDQGTAIAQHLPQELHIRYILATHGHNDHVGGVAQLRRLTGARYGIAASDEDRALSAQGPDELGYTYEANAPHADFYLEDSMVLDLGAASFKIMSVPGHTPGSVIIIGQGKAQGLVFTGDTLFKGSIGRTDLLGGDDRLMQQSLKRIVRELDPNSHIFPGHGDPSRMYKELEHNPFLQQYTA